MKGMDKNLHIIAGCNGAGKTTASYTVLSKKEFSEKLKAGIELAEKRMLEEPIKRRKSEILHRLALNVLNSYI